MYTTVTIILSYTKEGEILDNRSLQSKHATVQHVYHNYLATYIPQFFVFTFLQLFGSQISEITSEAEISQQTTNISIGI